MTPTGAPVGVFSFRGPGEERDASGPGRSPDADGSGADTADEQVRRVRAPARRLPAQGVPRVPLPPRADPAGPGYPPPRAGDRSRDAAPPRPVRRLLRVARRPGHGGRRLRARLGHPLRERLATGGRAPSRGSPRARGQALSRVATPPSRIDAVESGRRPGE